MRQQRSRRDLRTLTDIEIRPYFRVSRADAEDRKAASFEAERSTSTQRRIFREYARRERAVAGREYTDPDISASRFSSKKGESDFEAMIRLRPDFECMVRDIRSGDLDGKGLWFWEIERQQRMLSVFAGLRDLCREHGVFWVIRDRVADPANPDDMLFLGIKSMMAEGESEKLSVRVYDGKESAAAKGHRAGRFPYGYKRGKWDPVTETFGPDQQDVLDSDRNAVEDSPAFIVQEIFERLKAGHSITSIRRDLNGRGIPGPGGSEWSNSRIRYIAMNPAYAGLRVRHIEKGAGLSNRAAAILPGVKTEWPPLIDEETFWSVYRRLADPARTTTKPDRPGGRLLAGVARCGECGSKLTTKLAGEKSRLRGDMYACRERGCVGIYENDLDEYVTKVMIRWLSLPDTAKQLAANGDRGKAALARADLERANAEHADLLRSAKRGGVSLALAEAMEQEILTRIADAKQQIADAEAPPLLQGLVGEQAGQGWAGLTIPQRRQVIADVADIRVRRVGRSGNQQVPVRDRVEWHWLIGPGAGEDTPSAAERIEAHFAARAARYADRRAKVMHLRGEGWTRQEIAAELGISVHTVKKDVDVNRNLTAR
jgi:DNA invertase Pin-like site-specific DNA recombinase